MTLRQTPITMLDSFEFNDDSYDSHKHNGDLFTFNNSEQDSLRSYESNEDSYDSSESRNTLITVKATTGANN